ncbi:hypothetical protein [Streptomyces coelicoflavus]|uniref:hypothetical protein n=1 Tax=Streptomyces coelicoflavus TaxID=285562 RepID=UPI000D5A20DF|nr:hypothetical protein [Streptomyces coelicoflavus]
MDFRTALGIVLAELDPKPWGYTTPDGTLTVVPAGFRADKDEADVIVRVSDDVEEWVKTPEVAKLVTALREGVSWSDLCSGWGTEVTVDALGVTVAVWQKGVPTSVTLPSAQRLPLASALERALDVARGWEDEA